MENDQAFLSVFPTYEEEIKETVNKMPIKRFRGKGDNKPIKDTLGYHFCKLSNRVSNICFVQGGGGHFMGKLPKKDGVRSV
jgi:hypothetical protein